MLVLKDVSRPRLKPGSSGGEKSSNQTSTLQTESNPSRLVLTEVLVNLIYSHSFTSAMNF